MLKSQESAAPAGRAAAVHRIADLWPRGRGRWRCTSTRSTAGGGGRFRTSFFFGVPRVGLTRPALHPEHGWRRDPGQRRPRACWRCGRARSRREDADVARRPGAPRRRSRSDPAASTESAIAVVEVAELELEGAGPRRWAHRTGPAAPGRSQRAVQVHRQGGIHWASGPHDGEAAAAEIGLAHLLAQRLAGLQLLARAHPALGLPPQRRAVLLVVGQAVVVADDVGTLQPRSRPRGDRTDGRFRMLRDKVLCGPTAVAPMYIRRLRYNLRH